MAGTTHFVHPAQIYESLMCLVAFGIVLLIEKRKLQLGQVFAISIALYGVCRFIYEFWRAGASSTYWGGLPITEAQAAAGLLIVLGFVLFIVYGRKRTVQEQIPA